MNYSDDFKQYAVKHEGISSSNLHRFESHIQNSMTPYILEERKLNVTQMDVFSRLMNDRIIYVQGVVNDTMSSIVSAQLMYLDNLAEEDITLWISSGGGSVSSGLTMVDIMNYIGSDVATVNMGMAASMGSILLGNGTKGKRYMLPNARVMLHKVSSGMQGQIDNLEVSYQETKKYNTKLFDMLGEFCDKSPEEILEDSRLDFWMNATEAKDYGIVDEIIYKNK